MFFTFIMTDVFIYVVFLEIIFFIDVNIMCRFVISVFSFRALDIVPYVQDPKTGVVYFNVRGAEASPSPTQHNTYSGQPLTYNTNNRSPPTRSLHTRGRSPSPRRSVRPQSIRKQRHRVSLI